MKAKINLSEDYRAGLFNKQKLEKIQKLVDLQAEDEALWICDLDVTVPEAYLQHALRKLHAAIEANSIEEIDVIIEACKE